ncbi:DUF2141 domain-containing protein [Aureibaculum sp. A20]|uniref:DUF2141 domain-containing protein n=1 Tax=Aureibaculum flavum TaxID=2795986 RepID=A0ABS0WRM3_9FLAO|nr:DUF2141 domain-containing protein [Aureibaculum flavum]MBJ2174623.1 DUF2141 domain-containing protein [Aureibaculum flavum]
MIFKKVNIIIFLITSMVSWSQSTFNLKVSIEGLNSDEGKLFVAIYDHRDDFLKNPYQGEITEIINGKAMVEFNQLPQGTYAISSFHDENNNGKLDKNYFGIPKEPNACSNNAKARLGPPKYVDAKFNLEKENTSIKIFY